MSRVGRNIQYSAENVNKFRVLTYNLLADQAAKNHADQYPHQPKSVMRWQAGRLPKAVAEIHEYKPDIVCLQEVQDFSLVLSGLRRLAEEDTECAGSYDGWYTGKTGSKADGIASIWRTDKFSLVYHEDIIFSKVNPDLKDNVASVAVLQPVSQSNGHRLGGKSKKPQPSEINDNPSLQNERPNDSVYPQQPQKGLSSANSKPTGSHSADGAAYRLILTNIHVIFNPRRGDIKLTQLKYLWDRAGALCDQNQCAHHFVVGCGDYNLHPKSQLYNFCLHGNLNLAKCNIRKMKGHHSTLLINKRNKMQSQLPTDYLNNHQKVYQRQWTHKRQTPSQPSSSAQDPQSTFHTSSSHSLTTQCKIDSIDATPVVSTSASKESQEQGHGDGPLNADDALPNSKRKRGKRQRRRSGCTSTDSTGVHLDDVSGIGPVPLGEGVECHAHQEAEAHLDSFQQSWWAEHACTANGEPENTDYQTPETTPLPLASSDSEPQILSSPSSFQQNQDSLAQPPSTDMHTSLKKQKQKEKKGAPHEYPSLPVSAHFAKHQSYSQHSSAVRRNNAALYSGGSQNRRGQSQWAYRSQYSTKQVRYDMRYSVAQQGPGGHRSQYAMAQQGHFRSYDRYNSYQLSYSQMSGSNYGDWTPKHFGVLFGPECQQQISLELKQYGRIAYEWFNVHHQLEGQLRSAYYDCNGREPEYTCSLPGTLDTVDYIWYSPQSQKRASSRGWNGRKSLHCEATLQPPDWRQFVYGVLPDHAQPSDHISLVADFCVK